MACARRRRRCARSSRRAETRLRRAHVACRKAQAATCDLRPVTCDLVEGGTMAPTAQLTQAQRPKLRRRERWWRAAAPYVFISPFYIIFLAFGLLPIVFSLAVSLYDWRGTTPGAFVGLQNYRVLLQDPTFYKSLLNTTYVWLGSVPPMILLALVFASI